MGVAAQERIEEEEEAEKEVEENGRGTGRGRGRGRARGRGGGGRTDAKRRKVKEFIMKGFISCESYVTVCHVCYRVI